MLSINIEMHTHIQIFYTNTYVNNMHKLYINWVSGELLEAKYYVKIFFFLLFKKNLMLGLGDFPLVIHFQERVLLHSLNSP